MALSASLEGAKKAVLFPFKGKSWGVKMLIGSAMMFASYIIPIVPIIPLFGYFGRIMKRVINENEDPEMPEWNDWGGLFSEGIKIFGLAFLYMLPGVLVMVFGYMLFFVLNSAFLFSGNHSFVNDPYQFLNMGSIFGGMIGMFAGMLFFMLGMLVMMIMSVLMLPALGHMISKGDFGAGFRVREWWPIFKANISGYFLILCIVYGIYFVLFIPVYILYISVVLCWLMPFAMMFMIFLLGSITFSLSAVAYKDATMRLAAP